MSVPNASSFGFNPHNFTDYSTSTNTPNGRANNRINPVRPIGTPVIDVQSMIRSVRESRNQFGQGSFYQPRFPQSGG